MRLGVLWDQHLHDVESEKNFRIIEQAQPCEPALRNASLFLPIYRRQRPAKLLAASSFDFDKHKRVAIPTDDVDFAAAPAAKIAVKNFVTPAAQKTAGEFFTTRAAAKMLR